jgi:hypothetical protein
LRTRYFKRGAQVLLDDGREAFDFKFAPSPVTYQPHGVRTSDNDIPQRAGRFCAYVRSKEPAQVRDYISSRKLRFTPL